MITTGSLLRLHGKGLYLIGQFQFKVGESGEWEATVTTIDVATREQHDHPVWMILDLLKKLELYPPEQEKTMTELHKSRVGIKRKEDLYRRPDRDLDAI